MARTAKQVAAQKAAAAASAAKRRKHTAADYRKAGNAFSQHGMANNGKTRRVVARAAAGKPARKDLPRNNNRERAVGVMYGAEAHQRVGAHGTISPTYGRHTVQSHNANTTLSHGKPKSTGHGVARPTGPTAFTQGYKKPKKRK